MTLGEIDEKLQRLSDAAERIAANLLELDLDWNRKLLDESPLEGETAARWAMAKGLITQLWHRQAMLERLLEQARELRGTRRPRARLAGLTALLDEPSLELESGETPLERRTLLGDSQVTTRCSPDELIAHMSRAFAEATAVVAAAGGAWQALTPRLSAARELLAECARLADELGERGRSDLESAHRRLAELEDRLTRDPLAVDAAQVDELVGSAEALARDLRAAQELRRELGDRLTRARGLLAELGERVGEAEAARAETLSRIADPEIPPPPATTTGLDAGLVRIAALADRGDWREAQDALGRWTAAAASLAEQARTIAAASRAPLEARNELRELLAAYRAKAARMRLLEDPGLEEIFERAHDELYTAPTDIARARELVGAYQQAVNEPAAPREVPT